jgi:hypothetical protein
VVPSTPPSVALLALVAGAWVAPALAVAARLRVADLLAAATGSHARSLYRLLRALASHGVFAEDAEVRLHLTSLAHSLRSDTADSMRAFAEFWPSGAVWQARGALEHSVATNEPAFQQAFGVQFFPYLLLRSSKR